MRVIVLRPGRVRPDEKPKAPPVGPEGVPSGKVVIAQQVWALMDVVLVANPTVRMKIETRKFDPAVYRPAPPLPAVPAARRRELPDFSNEPERELLTWTVARLRALPEYLFVAKPAEDKTTLVKQILKVRGGPR